jgi:hypothetical protein
MAFENLKKKHMIFAILLFFKYSFFGYIASQFFILK